VGVAAGDGYIRGVIETRCEGRSALPVGKIVCVGRNYAAHAAEMGAQRPSEPLLFLKPPSALLLGGGDVRLPAWSSDVHHEAELVVRVSAVLSCAGPGESARAVDAYGVGLDLTARDVQARAKASGEPWTVAKGFDGAAPVSELIPIDGVEAVADLELALEVEGERRQFGRVRDMIWPVEELLAFASSRFTLLPGDLVFTGTPEGVGPVRSGEHLLAEAGAARLEVACVR